MKKLRYKLVFISWICIFALIGITAVLNNADKIDAWFAPDEVWATDGIDSITISPFWGGDYAEKAYILGPVKAVYTDTLETGTTLVVEYDTIEFLIIPRIKLDQ